MQPLSTLIPAQSVSFELPESIPAPKFSLFQRVHCVEGYSKGAVATIVGLQWMSRDSALLQQLPEGWHYSLSEIYGVTALEELYKLEPTESIAPESSLVAVEA